MPPETSGERAQILIPQLCPRHLEMVAAEERLAGTTIVVLTKVQIGLFQLWAGDPTVQAEAGRRAGPPESLADSRLFPAMLARQGCLGCWANDERLSALILHCVTGGTPGAKGQIYGQSLKNSEDEAP